MGEPKLRRVQRLAVKVQVPSTTCRASFPSARRPGRRASGWPIEAMWTRTWCVRPVSSRHSTSAASLRTSSRFQCVTARLPRLPSTMAIFLRLVAERASGASTVPSARLRNAVDDREIAPVDRMRGELLRQALVRDVGLGDDQQARRVLVDAVDDARPRNAADARQRSAAMVEQRVDQRAVEIARRRVDDQPGGLVDDQQMLVLEDDRQRDVLRLRYAPAWARALRREGSRRRGPCVAGSRTGLPCASTAPLRISAFSRSRDSVGTASASARSRRQPAWAGARRTSIV